MGAGRDKSHKRSSHPTGRTAPDRLPRAKPALLRCTARLTQQVGKPTASWICPSDNERTEPTRRSAAPHRWQGDAPSGLYAGGVRERLTGEDVRSENGAAQSAPPEVHHGKASRRRAGAPLAKVPKPIAPKRVRRWGVREVPTGGAIVDTQVHDRDDRGGSLSGDSRWGDPTRPMCRDVPPCRDSRRMSPNSVGATSQSRSRSTATKPSDV